ncbi:MAG: hypothetical protein ACI81P_000051 [Neolewinella sp.]|jgi:hypothetical protein
MTYSRFFTLLGIFTAVAVVISLICHALLPLGYAIPLTVGTILLFCAFCIGLFWVGSRTANAENKYLFSNVFMGVTMLKLFLCGGLIAAYFFLGEPENKLFVVPFFLSYLVYTTLEIVFLIKLAGNTAAVVKEKQE